MKRPKLTDTFMEVGRSCGEYAMLRLGKKSLSENARQGNDAPVMVLPGFFADDNIYNPLRNFLDEAGYKSYKWEAGRNYGLKPDTLSHIEEHLLRIFKENDGRKVHLVGHSLGGILAREMAREFPDIVDRVVTLGSPFGNAKKLDTVSPLVGLPFHILGAGGDMMGDQEILDRLIVPPDVPTSSVYTRSDGIVPWQGCLNPVPQDGERSENIEVRASHVGLAFNPAAFLAIADRLAAAHDDWKPFDKGAYDSILFPARQAHEDYVPPHPGKVSGHGKRLVFK